MPIPRQEPQKSLTKDSSDPEEVRRAKKRERQTRWQEMEDLRNLLDTPGGRRFIWRLWDHSGAFRSVWHPSAAIHRNSGMQDIGLWVFEEVKEARDTAFAQIWNEAKEREEADRQFVDNNGNKSLSEEQQEINHAD
ncbi:MAG TPA: hypothetical protein VJ521_00445 [Acidobacteriota bacterium]|nr:hypothetical protein [Acidobacteriota bacterium]